ncbi:hypothetical protein HED54_16385 [Ochrobactrum anthropi ATCC 49188]|nr:hypothetical protein [Brucella anthropi ATCC 49188]
MKFGKQTAVKTETPYLHRLPRKYKLAENCVGDNSDLSQNGTDYVSLAINS